MVCKNVPIWERVVRIMMGVMMIAGGLMVWKGSWMGYGAAAAGVMMIGTGMMGFCPMCAIGGRTLPGK